jgi:hypothetical protein
MSTPSVVAMSDVAIMPPVAVIVSMGHAVDDTRTQPNCGAGRDGAHLEFEPVFKLIPGLCGRPCHDDRHHCYCRYQESFSHFIFLLSRFDSKSLLFGWFSFLVYYSFHVMRRMETRDIQGIAK